MPIIKKGKNTKTKLTTLGEKYKNKNYLPTLVKKYKNKNYQPWGKNAKKTTNLRKKNKNKNYQPWEKVWDQVSFALQQSGFVWGKAAIGPLRDQEVSLRVQHLFHS